MRVEDLRPEDLRGSLLLLEYQVLGIGTRSFATNDRSGRGTLLAMAHNRLAIATRVCEQLIADGAVVCMLSLLCTSTEDDDCDRPKFSARPSGGIAGFEWALQRRHVPAYLHLQQTFDATLATLGQKTRSNMRYYRRRAERDLGCRPVFDAKVSERELVRFNRECMYPVDTGTVQWRYRVLQALHDGFLIGMKDRDGRWLSILAGRRFGGTSEILWQMNRAGFPAQSLSTVMRSYCMEHEIGRGARRLQVEGGTFHSMSNSFVLDEVVDLVVMRASFRPVVQRLSQYFVKGDNRLAEMLRDDALAWNRA